jgi:hypothetical protein
MKTNKIALMFALAALLTGCVTDEQLVSPPPVAIKNKEIVLGVNGLSAPPNNAN